MFFCLCLYTHRTTYKDGFNSKICMYVSLLTLVWFFATLISFKPEHENDGHYYGPDSNYRRFNSRSYDRWKREYGHVTFTWEDYGG